MNSKRFWLLGAALILLTACGPFAGAKPVTARRIAAQTQAPLHAANSTVAIVPRGQISTSAAAQVIRAFYRDINDQDYQAAYLTLSSAMRTGRSESEFAAGYTGTPEVLLSVGKPTATSKATVVPVELRIPAVGYVTVYRGTYTVALQNGSLHVIAATVPSGVSVGLDHLRMLTESQGFAWNAKTLFETSSGGQTWQSITPSSLSANQSIAAASFSDASHGWLAVLGPGGDTVDVYRTSDGGSTWYQSSVSMPQGLVDVAHATLSTPDSSDIWLMLSASAGSGSEPIAIEISRDGGATFKPAYAPPPGTTSVPTTYGLKSAPVFNSRQDGFLTGTSSDPAPYFFATSDGAASWSAETLPTLCSICLEFTTYPPVFPSNKDGLLLVAAAPPPSPDRHITALYSTVNGGQSWSLGPVLQTFDPFLGVADLLSAHSGYLVAGNTLYSLTAAGWQNVISLPEFSSVMQIDFVSQNVGFALIGGNGPFHLPQLLQTTDGGRSWSQEPALVTGSGPTIDPNIL